MKERKEHWRAFDKSWFLRHQACILWLLNTWLIGRWFRWVLRIRSCDVGFRRQIVQVLPHCFTVFGDNDGTLTTDFRTHQKYSKRLYGAFRPLWWLLHYWDEFLADRFVPQLSFGFATLTIYPDPDPETSTVDGFVERDAPGGITVGEDWAALRDGSGTGAASDFSPGDGATIYCSETTDKYFRLDRAIFLFDTSSLGGTTPTSATLSLFSSPTATNGTGSDPTIDIYTSTPASNTDLVAADYQQIGSISQTGNPKSWITEDWQLTNSYKDFGFNATGLGNINPSGVSKFGARNANWDVANTPAPWVLAGLFSFDIYYSENTGTAKDPKLVVTFPQPALNTNLTKLTVRPRSTAPGLAR